MRNQKAKTIIKIPLSEISQTVTSSKLQMLTAWNTLQLTYFKKKILQLVGMIIVEPYLNVVRAD